MEGISSLDKNGTKKRKLTGSLYLPLLDWETRVLCLHPAQDHEPLAAELIIGVCIAGDGLGLRNVNRTIEYDALSYTWGEPVFDHHIKLKGEHVENEVPITSNLHGALRHLRLPDVSRYIWADAVCIDQSNPEERSSQVRGMFSIYKKASTVVVWLGQNNGPYVSKALNLARCLDEDALDRGVPRAAFSESDSDFDAPEKSSLSPSSAMFDSLSDMSDGARLERRNSRTSENSGDEGDMSDDDSYISGRSSRVLPRETDSETEPASPGRSRSETASTDSAAGLPWNIVQWNNPSCMSLSKQLDPSGEMLSTELTENALCGLYDLMNRTWLRRVWIIQEVFAARRISVLSGRHTFGWPLFRLLAGATEYALGDAKIKGLDVSQGLPMLGEVLQAAKFLNQVTTKRGSHDHIERTRPDWNECWCLQLILQAVHVQATDPRDHVYALLGLFAKPPSRWKTCDHKPDIIVDYRKSVSHVYQDVVRHYLRAHARLDFLYLHWERPSDLSFPSWLPDWRSCAAPSEPLVGVLERHVAPAKGICSAAPVSDYDIIEIHGFKIADMCDIWAADRQLDWVERIRCFATAWSESADVPRRKKTSVLRVVKKAAAALVNDTDVSRGYELFLDALDAMSRHQHSTDGSLLLSNLLRSLWQAAWHRFEVPNDLLKDDILVQPLNGPLPLILREQENGRFQYTGFPRPKDQMDQEDRDPPSTVTFGILHYVEFTLESCGQDDVFVVE